MHADGPPFLKTSLEVIAFEHTGDRVLGCERHNLLGGELPQPFTVEAQRSPRRVEYLVQLCCIRPGIYQNVISRERLAGFGFPRRITDHPGKITDDQNHLMAEFLKLS